MEKYNPPFRITNNILNLVSKIVENISRIRSHESLDKLPKLRKQNRIRSIYSSCAIEANSLSINQVSDIINGKNVVGPQREIQEVKNAIEAYNIVDKINPFEIEDLKKIHKMLTIYLVDKPGEFRLNEEGVFEGDKCIFVAPPAKSVPKLMDGLYLWLNENSNNIHPLILSSVFHYEFVFVHPFQDGNGRTVRLIQNAILGKFNSIFYWLPIENYIKDNQKEYYDAIANCHLKGESTIFIEFMLTMINEALINVDKDINTHNQNISIYMKKILDIMEISIPYTAIEIMRKLKLKSKETFRKNYLNPAIEKGFIRYEVPDKPTSKNQRYIRDI
ncbi:MAG: Fic family protein [Bacilli bacterium]|nr:Fic family protein [Bacilli bacterium]